jgi:hypothetical protein
MYTTPADQTVKRHPLRGLLYGLLMGLGIAILLITTNTVAIGTLPPILVVVFSTLFGIIWGLFAPPRKAKDQAPAQIEPIPAQDPAAVAAAGAAAPSAEPIEPMTAEETATSRDTVVNPGGPADHGGTIIDPPTEPDESID